MKKYTPAEWAEIVSDVIAAQPELVAVTVGAVQEVILRDRERQLDRISTISTGLVQALSTQPHHVKRQHDLVIAAIKDSNYHPSKWSAEMIARGSGMRMSWASERVLRMVERDEVIQDPLCYAWRAKHGGYSVTNSINALVKRGLVAERAVGENPRRAVLTDAGRAYRERARKQHEQT